MLFFSGFGLKNEEMLFNFWLEKNDFCVAGFSYGAIKAVEYCLNSESRVDRLILLSPAFFNDKDSKYKRMQLMFYSKDKQAYTNNFLQNITNGSNVDLTPYLNSTNKEQLEELLYYSWSKKKLQTIASIGTTIEVILGGKDKIIDAKKAKEFFEDVATVYYIKDANHILESSN